MRKLLIAILVIVGSLSLSVALFEFGLRLAGVSYPVLQAHDPIRGFKLRPGASGWWLREGKAFVEINPDGQRDRLYDKAKPSDTLRIAVLGDSFAEARSVAVTDTFWAVMEQELNRCLTSTGKAVEVINFGVTDYGTAQELLTLRHHVWDYGPDVVLLAFFAGNDIRNNHRRLEPKKYRPFYNYDGGDLVVDNSFLETSTYRILSSQYGRTILFLSDYFITVQLMREAFVRLKLRKPRNDKKDKHRDRMAEAGIDVNNIYKAPDDANWQQAWRVTEGLVDRIADEVEAGGARFLAVTLSTALQVHPDTEYRQKVMADLGVSDLSYPDLRIKSLGDRRGFDVLNLATDLRQYAETHKAFLHGFENTELGTGHWNEMGHHVAGKLIADFLCTGQGANFASP